MTLLELAARVEAAEGPDRGLDAEIASLMGVFPPNIKYIGYYVDPGTCCADGVIHVAKSYTASIDAALTLVPDGWTGVIPVRGGANEEAWLWPDNGTMNRGLKTTAATPALALLAACLKAHGGGE